MVDDVIDPRETRIKLYQGLMMLKNKKEIDQRKNMATSHYNIGGLKMTQINEERLVKEFIELVQVDSETKNEGKIAEVLKEKFSKLGLEVVEDDAKSKTGHGANNLICTLKGTKEGVFYIFYLSYGYSCSRSRS